MTKRVPSKRQAVLDKPPEAAPVLGPLAHHNVTRIFVWAKPAPANSKNKNSTGAAAGTCLPNKSKNARPFGA